jgi:hypothetical protein
MACAPFDKDATLETQKEPTPQSVEKNTPQDSIRIKIPKDFFDSLYHEWSLQWKKNYSRDTALYQGITNCMHPENTDVEKAEIVTVRPLVENVVAATTEGFSKDGKTHIFYDETPIEPLRKRTYDEYFFPSAFAFIFSEDSLLGIRPQWIAYESTSDYKAQLSQCAKKFDVKVLDEITTRQVFEQQDQRLEELFRNRK